MKDNSFTHMLDKPYIRAILYELQIMGYERDKAKQLLIRFYRPVRRTWGFEPNARDFAREIEELHRAVLKKYDPSDPDQIYIGHLRERLRKGRTARKRNLRSLD